MRREQSLELPLGAPLHVDRGQPGFLEALLEGGQALQQALQVVADLQGAGVHCVLPAASETGDGLQAGDLVPHAGEGAGRLVELPQSLLCKARCGWRWHARSLLALQLAKDEGVVHALALEVQHGAAVLVLHLHRAADAQGQVGPGAVAGAAARGGARHLVGLAGAVHHRDGHIRHDHLRRRRVAGAGLPLGVAFAPLVERR
mmetsp:Transcript_25509/g.76704  ORF Transcript_25509/g.76704 Transcript_25509/m.76704 type:complete len:202 (-) Transcript_25509:94-699(-)